MATTAEKSKTKKSGSGQFSTVEEMLNEQIADWGVLYVKLHNFHWYVTGPNFFTLHVKFEELYKEAALYFDELAERLLAIGGKPLATMSEYLEVSSIKEPTKEMTAEDMVENLVQDFEAVIGELKEGMALAQEQDDETTADLLLKIHQSLEKHTWMLKSFLG